MRSFLDGVLPDAWKKANVSPLHKSGSKIQVSNYRPVSLTSIVGKVMEKIMRDELMVYLVSNKLINVKQHGFMPGKSCATNLLEFIDKVTYEIEQGNYVDVIYTDFSKAFDKVSHTKLLVKLKAYGIIDESYEWIRSFLTGRKQRIILGEASSDWAEVTSGVPQGSVLGPILFVIYINDLLDAIQSPSLSYADDLKLLGVFNRAEMGSQRLQEDLNLVNNWSKTWSAELNVLKCKTMYTGANRDRKKDYFISSGDNLVALKETTCEKDLGVFVSNDLKWNKQCSAAAAKANRVLGQIRNSFVSLDMQTLKLLYSGLVRPHLEYAVSMWNPSTKSNIAVIEKVQRRATKLVKNLRKKTYEERLKSLGLMNLEDRRARGDLIQMFKIVNRQDEINLTKGVNWANSLKLNLRRKNDKRLVREITKRGSHRYNFLTNRVVPMWNGLSQDVIDSKTVNSFKSGIDREVFGVEWKKKRETATALES